MKGDSEMKNVFEEPIIEVLPFNVEDIITTSGDIEQGENEGPIL